MTRNYLSYNRFQHIPRSIFERGLYYNSLCIRLLGVTCLGQLTVLRLRLVTLNSLYFNIFQHIPRSISKRGLFSNSLCTKHLSITLFSSATPTCATHPTNLLRSPHRPAPKTPPTCATHPNYSAASRRSEARSLIPGSILASSTKEKFRRMVLRWLPSV